jgi:hypothetical protein
MRNKFRYRTIPPVILVPKGEKQMNDTLQKTSKSRLRLLTSLFVALIATTCCYGQDQKPNGIAGVENTKMGAYRALAQLSFEAFKGGDKALAAKLARILERTWDQGEEGSCNNAFKTTNPSLFQQIDQAMDLFIRPIVAYEKTSPDLATVEATYDDYVKKLKSGDQ